MQIRNCFQLDVWFSSPVCTRVLRKDSQANGSSSGFLKVIVLVVTILVSILMSLVVKMLQKKKILEERRDDELIHRLTLWFLRTVMPVAAGTAAPSSMLFFLFWTFGGKYLLFLSGDGQRWLEGSQACLCQWMGREDTGSPHFHCFLPVCLSQMCPYDN